MFLAWSNVSAHTAMKNRPHRMIERIGAMNQLATIMPSLPQLMLLEPTAARPEPISAPTTVCVPEIGIPKTEEAIMKINELIEEPSIICSVNLLSKVSTFSMMFPTSYPATCPLHQ